MPNLGALLLKSTWFDITRPHKHRVLNRLFEPEVAAVYLFGPLLLAPLTGGDSLFCYVLPFLIFDFSNWNLFSIGCWAWLGWFVISLFISTMHQFIRMTLRYNLRKVRAQGHFQQTYR
jgi:hypothetical protein